MTKLNDLKSGDRVKVTFEGTWQGSGAATLDDGLVLGHGYKLYADGVLNQVKSVEKMEPPVTVFSPGDTVKSRAGNVYTLGLGGYFDHQGRSFHEYDDFIHAGYFTSKHHTLATIN